MPYLTLTLTENLKLQLSPGLVASYDIQPGNGVGLFWDKHVEGRQLIPFSDTSLLYLLAICCHMNSLMSSIQVNTLPSRLLTTLTWLSNTTTSFKHVRCISHVIFSLANCNHAEPWLFHCYPTKHHVASADS